MIFFCKKHFLQNIKYLEKLNQRERGPLEKEDRIRISAGGLFVKEEDCTKCQFDIIFAEE